MTGSVIPIRSNPNRMSKLNIPIDSSRRNSDTSHIFPTAVTAPRVFHVDHKAVEPCRPPLQRGNQPHPTRCSVSAERACAVRITSGEYISANSRLGMVGRLHPEAQRSVFAVVVGRRDMRPQPCTSAGRGKPLVRRTGCGTVHLATQPRGRLEAARIRRCPRRTRRQGSVHSSAGRNTVAYHETHAGFGGKSDPLGPTGSMEPPGGIEPPTFSLRVKRSTD